MSEPVYRACYVFGRGMFGLWDVHLDVTGDEVIPAEGGAVLAITHFGYFDFALAEWVVHRRTGRYLRFLVTTAAFRHRVAGPLLRAMRHIPVDRRSGAGAVDRSIRALQSGELIGIFPEASVSPSFTVKSCKTGAVRLAAQAGVPLIPVGVWGGQRLITRGHPGWTAAALRRTWGRSAFAGRHAPVHMRVGAPITLAPDADPVAATADLRRQLVDLVETAQQDYPSPADPAAAWWLPAHLGGAAPPPPLPESTLPEPARPVDRTRPSDPVTPTLSSHSTENGAS